MEVEDSPAVVGRYLALGMWASCYHGPRSVTGNIEVVYFTRQGSDAVISVSLIVCVNGYEGKGFHNNKVNKINYVLEHYLNNLLGYIMRLTVN